MIVDYKTDESEMPLHKLWELTAHSGVDSNESTGGECTSKSLNFGGELPSNYSDAATSLAPPPIKMARTKESTLESVSIDKSDATNDEEEAKLTTHHVSEAKEIVLNRYTYAKLGLRCLFSVALILNIILSLFADSENNYTPFNRDHYRNGVSYTRGHGDFTISHSMTGDYSKCFALFFMFICSLYYTSITHYQLVVFQCIEKNLIASGSITAKRLLRLRRYNQFAYTASNVLIISLLSLTIFDVRNFKVAHRVFAGIWFLSGWLHAHLLMKIEGILIKSNALTVRDKYTEIYYWSMVVAFVMFATFTITKRLIKNKKHTIWVPYVAITVMHGLMEYIYVILIILTVTSSHYERRELWDLYDFPELLHTRIFSFEDILIDLIRVMKEPLLSE